MAGSAFAFPVSSAELVEMAKKRKKVGLSLAKANKARKALGLKPLGFLASSGLSVIRVPRQW